MYQGDAMIYVSRWCYDICIKVMLW